jgi:polyferredoxin
MHRTAIEDQCIHGQGDALSFAKLHQWRRCTLQINEVLKDHVTRGERCTLCLASTGSCCRSSTPFRRPWELAAQITALHLSSASMFSSAIHVRFDRYIHASCPGSGNCLRLISKAMGSMTGVPLLNNIVSYGYMSRLPAIHMYPVDA